MASNKATIIDLMEEWVPVNLKSSRDVVEERAIKNLEWVCKKSPRLDSVLRKLFKPVHIQGGPCMETAPEGEEFVPASERSRVTCQLCQVTVGLVEDPESLIPDAPSPIADKQVLVHLWTTQTNIAGKPVFACGLTSFNVRGITVQEVYVGKEITCPECRREFEVQKESEGQEKRKKGRKR